PFAPPLDNDCSCNVAGAGGPAGRHAARPRAWLAGRRGAFGAGLAATPPTPQGVRSASRILCGLLAPHRTRSRRRRLAMKRGRAACLPAGPPAPATLHGSRHDRRRSFISLTRSNGSIEFLQLPKIASGINAETT